MRSVQEELDDLRRQLEEVREALNPSWEVDMAIEHYHRTGDRKPLDEALRRRNDAMRTA